MKEIFDDIMSEGFTKKEMVKYGVVYPLALVLAMILVSYAG